MSPVRDGDAYINTSAMTTHAATSKILVVDDNLHVLSVVSNMLRFLGFQADIAHSVVEAQEMISFKDYDFVFTDLDMPDMDGIRLGSWIIQRSPTTHVVIMTGRGKFEVTSLMQSSVFVWLFKPFRIQEIQSVLRGFT